MSRTDAATESLADAGRPTPVLGLTIAHHPDAELLGGRVEVEVGSTLELGRQSDALGQGALADGSISRRHARIEVSSAGHGELLDEGSHNGTHLNGRRVARATLRPGDVVRLGRILLTVDAQRRPAAAAEPLPGFVGWSPAHHRVARVVASVPASVLDLHVWGEPGSGRRSLALATGVANDDVVDLRLSPENPRTGRPPERRVVGFGTAPLTELRQRAKLQDWVARVKSWSFHLPPLRERPADIAALAWEFARRFGGPDAVPSVALVERLCRGRWEWNATQLEAVVERAVLEADERIDVFEGLDALLVTDPEHSRASHNGGARLAVHRDGDWFRLGATQRCSLSNTPLLRRILRALVDTRHGHPGRALHIDTVFESGWPGQKALPDARRNRVHVALTKLRKRGLGDVLQRIDSGYRIDPSVSIEILDN